jgi:hypothetical protein
MKKQKKAKKKLSKEEALEQIKKECPSEMDKKEERKIPAGVY